MKREYAPRKDNRKQGNHGNFESVFNRDKLLATLLEGSARNLDTENTKHLSFIKANCWSSLESKDSGVHFRVEFAKDPFIRLDRLSQKQLAKNVRKMMSCHMYDLARIYNRKQICHYFSKWRSCVVSKFGHFVFRYKTSLRYTFLMWKTFARSRRLESRSRRQACIALACTIWRSNNGKLKRAVKQWKLIIKSFNRLLRHSFDEWSLWALRSKLLKCNILKIFKALSARKALRSSKRIRWYFENWREKAHELTSLLILRKNFNRWKSRQHIYDEVVRTLVFAGKRRLERKTFSSWRNIFLNEDRLRRFYGEQEVVVLRAKFHLWVLFHRALQRLRQFIDSHCQTVLRIKADTRDTASEVDLAPIVSAEEPKAIHQNCKRKSCRCVRCLSRYGHLGAVTAPRRYALSSSSEVYASPRLSWNSQSFVSAGDAEEGYSVPWNTVHATSATSSARDEDKSRDIPKKRKERHLNLQPYSVAIPESQCTFMEHLEIRINDLSDLTAQFEQRKQAIEAAGGKSVVTRKKLGPTSRRKKATPSTGRVKQQAQRSGSITEETPSSALWSLLEGEFPADGSAGDVGKEGVLGSTSSVMNKSRSSSNSSVLSAS